jgi:hypothetical protein
MTTQSIFEHTFSWTYLLFFLFFLLLLPRICIPWLDLSPFFSFLFVVASSDLHPVMVTFHQLTYRISRLWGAVSCSSISFLYWELCASAYSVHVEVDLGLHVQCQVNMQLEMISNWYVLLTQPCILNHISFPLINHLELFFRAASLAWSCVESFPKLHFKWLLDLFLLHPTR